MADSRQRSHSPTPLWSLSPRGPPLPMRPPSRLPLQVSPLSMHPPSRLPLQVPPLSMRPPSRLPLQVPPLPMRPPSRLPLQVPPLSMCPPSRLPLQVPPLPMRPPSRLPLQVPPLPIRPPSRVPLQVPFLMSSQTSLPSLPPTLAPSKRNVSYGPTPPPRAQHGWGSVAPLATGFRNYAPGPSSVGTKPFGSGPDFSAAPLPPPLPKVNMRVNEFVENKVKIEMFQLHKSAFPSPNHGTGVFHPIPSAQLQPNKKKNKGKKQKERRVANAMNIPNGNEDVMVKQKECDELSIADEYGLPKEWTY